MSGNALRELLDEQAHAWICGRFGHRRKFRLPPETKPENHEVLAICEICRTTSWIQLPEDGWKRFLEDMTAGKIK